MDRTESSWIGSDWIGFVDLVASWVSLLLSFLFVFTRVRSGLDPVWDWSFFPPQSIPFFPVPSVCPPVPSSILQKSVAPFRTNQPTKLTTTTTKQIDNDSNDQHHRSQRQSPSDRLTVCLDRSIHPSIHQLIHGTFPTFNTRVRLFIPFQSIPLHST